MGRDKALLPWPPEPQPGRRAQAQTFLGAQIALLQRYSELVIVVAGKNSAAITPLTYRAGAFLVTNPFPEHGQFSSLQIGVQEVLNRGRDAAIVALVDRPPAIPATLDVLRTTFLNALSDGKWAVVPEYQGKHGHPIFASREMITAWLRAAATATARDVEHQHQDRISYVPVSDPLVTANIDTPSDYAQLQAQVSSVSGP
jgi:molybdenum cofactor cytidylyltransferase